MQPAIRSLKAIQEPRIDRPFQRVFPESARGACEFCGDFPQNATVHGRRRHAAPKQKGSRMAIYSQLVFSCLPWSKVIKDRMKGNSLRLILPRSAHRFGLSQLSLLKRVLNNSISIACLFTSINAWAQFTFTTNNGTIAITGYTGPGGAVAIPSETNGWPVCSIADSAFSSKSSLKSVTIPNSVTNLGVNAFSSCSALESVSIGSGISRIGSYAFQYCMALTNVSLSGTLNSIGDHAFYHCTKLPAVTVPGSVITIEASAFAACDGL